MDRILCDFCNKEFKSLPIHLPCNKTVCETHLYNKDFIKCIFCDISHYKNDDSYYHNYNKEEKQYPINNDVLIKLKQIKLNSKIDLLNDKLKDFELTQNEPYSYVYNYFDKLTNQIDLRREKIIDSIMNHFDNELNKISDLKTKFKNLENEKSESIEELKNFNVQSIRDSLSELDLNLININSSCKIKHLKEAENKIDELERTLACKLDNFLDNKDFELSEMCDDLCLTKLFGQVLEKNKKRSNIWKRETGECVSTFHLNEPEYSISTNQFFLSNGNDLIAYSHNGKCVKILDNKTGVCKRTFPFNLSNNCAKISQSGCKIISGTDYGEVNIYDYKTGECLKSFNAHDLEINDLIETKDETRLITASYNIKIWRMNHMKSRYPKCLMTLNGHNNYFILSLALDNENGHLFSGSMDTTIKMWNLNNGKCLKTFHGHLDGVTQVILNNDNNLLISGSEAIEIKIWDIEEGHCLRTIRNISISRIHVLLLNGNNEFLCSSSDSKIRLFDIESGECLTEISIEKQLINFFISDEGYLMTYTCDDIIKTWN